MPSRGCLITGCTGLAHSRGLCVNCYKKAQRRHILDNYPLRDPATTSIKKRLQARGWTVAPTGCWILNGCKSQTYPYFGHHDHRMPLSRAAYLGLVGEIPEGHAVKRTCNNTHCIRPDHFYLQKRRPSKRETKGHDIKGCSEEGCYRVHYGRGLCKLHWRQHRDDGTLDQYERKLAVPGMTLDERLRHTGWTIKRGRNGGCWLWKGTLVCGYPVMSTSFKIGNHHHATSALRAAWLAWNGEIPPSCYIRQTCDEHSCINPDHLTLWRKNLFGDDSPEEERAQPRVARPLHRKLTPEQIREIDARTRKARLALMRGDLSRAAFDEEMAAIQRLTRAYTGDIIMPRVEPVPGAPMPTVRQFTKGAPARIDGLVTKPAQRP